MDDLKDKSLNELVDMMWGRMVIAIGKGTGKEEMSLIIMKISELAYERGLGGNLKC